MLSDGVLFVSQYEVPFQIAVLAECDQEWMLFIVNNEIALAQGFDIQSMVHDSRQNLALPERAILRSNFVDWQVVAPDADFILEESRKPVA